MTVREKRAAVEAYCMGTKCSKCVLSNKGWKTELETDTKCLNIKYATNGEINMAYGLINQPAAVQENGGNNMEEQIINISLERYEELIKKEALYDELTKDKKTNMYLFQEVNEPLRGCAKNE